MSYQLQTQLYTVTAPDHLAEIEAWVMNLDHSAVLIELDSGEGKTWRVSVTDCVSPEVMITDRRTQFESLFGSWVQALTLE